MTDDKREFEDLLRAAETDDRIDPAFQSDLRRRMLAAFQQARRRGSRPGWSRPGFRMGIGVAVGVAAGLLLVTVGWFGQHPAITPPDLSFAVVQQRVQQMNAVQYRQTVTVTSPEGPTGGITSDVVNVDAARWQVVKPDGEVLQFGSADSATPGVQFVADRPPPSAAATTQPSALILRVFDELLAARPESVTLSGARRVINDRPAVGYSIDRTQRTTEVWVDTQTHLPVLVQDVLADKTARVTASDLQWTPRDRREVVLRPLPRSEGKILVAPTGGNIDHMPMMAIPEGCKILIPGMSDRSPGPSARARDQEQARRYQQKLEEEMRRRGSAGTQPSGSQPLKGPAEQVVRLIALHGDPLFVAERLRRFLEGEYGRRAASRIMTAVPGSDGHRIILKGTQEQVEASAELARWLDDDSTRLRPRSAATSPSRPPPSTQPSASQTQPGPPDLVVRVVEVHVDPTEIAAALQRVFERAYGGKKAVEFTPVSGEGGRFLIIDGTHDRVDRAVKLVESFDQTLRAQGS